MVLSALGAVDDPSVSELRGRANSWLMEHQLTNGSWGESCATYWDPYHTLTNATEGTPSQTAWALMGLSGNDRDSLQSVHRGLNFLLDTQRSDGSWEEKAFTGVGFPRAFYLHYDLYRIYFPLLALSKWGFRLHVVNGRPSLIHPYPILYRDKEDMPHEFK